MSIREKIESDMRQALKERDSLRLGALRLVVTALKNQEIENLGQLDDEGTVRVLQRLARQRRESIEQYEKAGRQDLAEKERRELEILSSYLPSAPGEEELRRAVREAIARTGATSPRDMGAVMKEVLARFRGQPLDGKQVSALVRAELGG
ncbi:MAG TPA: GatB/YqeY domain-containing protein [Candidatus Nitrosotenuis sp.]|jgi:uncharacterized protein YqeY|nr:GatB/YqeY domain-containing protein [Candidatus Nitrosotenuis sp.]